MTDLEVIEKLTKENERLRALALHMHSRVVALSTRVADLEMTIESYASNQTHLNRELAEARTRVEILAELHDERFDNWTDTKWGA